MTCAHKPVLSSLIIVAKMLLLVLFGSGFLASCIIHADASAMRHPYKVDELTETQALKFLNERDILESEQAYKQVFAEWSYVTNITDENEKAKLLVSAEYAKFQKEQWKRASQFPWRTYKDENIRRRFQLSSVLGPAALSEDKYKKYEEAISGMQSAWTKARICDYHKPSKCDLSLRPEITELLAKSHDEKELKHAWVEFRRSTGANTRSHFINYVKLSNEAALANNFTNAAEMWLHGYETPDFREQLTELWRQLEPLYLQLHAYVRKQLKEKYGENVVRRDGPIPSHLLGHIHAQTWANIADLMLPFPGRSSPDITPNLVKQGYTPEKIFRAAEEFFTSLNLTAMPQSFWSNSALEKPTDGREFECQASAWDFYDAKDFRIKQCTRVTQDHFYTAHHEMGHVEYFLQYKHQPPVFRGGANPGFHEAVGDVISLSVSTPKHLRTIGLLEDDKSNSQEIEASKEAMINHLFLVALDKVAFIPSALMMDEWRWDVFEGRVKPDDYNYHWWKLRERYQGVEPASDRTEEDFDPGSKYHIVANVPYIRYFVSYIIQFQFHQALCQKAGQLEGGAPLHECDIYRSTEAGNLLGSMLQLGASKPWPEAMALLTGQERMDATALRDYFAPLEAWLKTENERTGEKLGWETTQKACIGTRKTPLNTKEEA